MVVEARPIEGLDELRRSLQELPKILRNRVLRNALAAGARIVRDEAKRSAPLLQRATPYRKQGTMRDAIVVRTSRQARRRGDVGVFVNVKPAKRAQRGGKSRDDPFYWRWQEFGWTPASGPRKGLAGRRAAAQRRRARRSGQAPRIPGAKFLQRATAALPRALERFEAVLGPQIKRLNKKL